MSGRIEYSSPKVIKLPGDTHAMGLGITWWPATEHTPEHYSIGWSQMTRDQVRAFGRQLLEITTEPDAAVPDGEDPLHWLKMCIQGYDYLLMDDGGPDRITWREARNRGRRRIIAACLAVAASELEENHG